MSHKNFNVVDKAHVFTLHNFMHEKLIQRSQQTGKKNQTKNLILTATIQYCFANAYENISYVSVSKIFSRLQFISESTILHC